MRCAHPSRRCIMRKKSLDANPGFLFEFGGERGVDSLRSPCGPPLAVQNADVLSNPVEASRPSRRCIMQKKSLDANPGFLFKFGGERGLDSLRSPCGPPLAVQNAGVLSNPVEASRPSRRCTMQKKSLDANPGFLFKFGGERGVRTLDTLSRIHTFQACSFSHSDTSPFCCRKRFALSTGANVGESDLSVNPLISFS